MSRQTHLPKLRRHKPSKQGMVRLCGQDHYLGRWPEGMKDPPVAVRCEYDRLVSAWIGNGRQVLRPAGDGGDGPSVNEVALAYLRHAETYYRKPDGSPTSELANVKLALRRMKEAIGRKAVSEVDGLDLETIRRRMIADGMVRAQINKTVGRIRRVFKWGVARNLVPLAAWQKLTTVEGLRAGRSDAAESDPVQPVPVAFVDATLPFLRPQVAAMVQLQRLTGMRPGEVCAMRTCDLETGGAVWFYRPAHHKTAHHGKRRVIAIGPQAQAVLRPWLRTGLQEYLFQPAESVAAFRAEQRASRKSKVQPSQVDRRRKRRKRQPSDRYGKTAYVHAIYRAVDAANRANPQADPIPRWAPNQLRHLHASEVRKRFGLEAAQVALGHAHAAVTEIYAERDLGLAAKVAAEIG